MFRPFQATIKYHAGEYHCIKCLHKTIIFVDTKYSMFGLMERDKICFLCNTLQPIVSDGSLIIRYDWPDADDYPWQLQAGYMKEEERYCKKCQNKVSKDWRKIIVTCSKCESYMEYIG